MPYQDPIWGQLDTGEGLIDVTLKEKVDEFGTVTDALIARGFVDDIQPGVDHVTVWNQDKPGLEDHHDMRFSEPMFPDNPGLF